MYARTQQRFFWKHGYWCNGNIFVWEAKNVLFSQSSCCVQAFDSNEIYLGMTWADWLSNTGCNFWKWGCTGTTLVFRLYSASRWFHRHMISLLFSHCLCSVCTVCMLREGSTSLRHVLTFLFFFRSHSALMDYTIDLVDDNNSYRCLKSKELTFSPPCDQQFHAIFYVVLPPWPPLRLYR